MDAYLLKKNPGLPAIVMLVVMLMVPVSAGALDVQAHVDRSRISLNESLNLTVSLSGGEGTVDSSSIVDFQVVSRGTSTRVQIVNSHVSKTTVYQYVLIPQKVGKFTIPPLPVMSGGHAYHTRPITVEVTQTSVNKADGNRDVFVTAEVSNDSPYVGQQICYSFRLYHAVSISNARLQKPEFSGFNAKEVDDSRTYNADISGRSYNVTELDYVLIPITSGRMTIGPAVLSCDVQIRQGGGYASPFDSFFGGGQRVQRVFSTNSLTVTVSALPDSPGNVPFSGLVGEFSLDASLESDTIAAGDSTTLAVVFQGTGNIMDVEEPRIQAPEGFKVYSDSPEEHINFDSRGYSGKKTFRKALVATKEGAFTIAPIRMSYFDIGERTYKILETPPLKLKAVPPADAEMPIIMETSEAEPPRILKKKKVEFTGRDILSLKTEPDVMTHSSVMPLTRFVVLLLIPFLICVGIHVACVVGKSSNDPQREMAERARRNLRQASDARIDLKEFLGCLYKALISAVYSRTGSRGESLTYQEVDAFLKSGGCSDTLSERASRLLKDIEFARYGGTEMDAAARTKLLGKTRQLIRDLQRR